jgi:hypothetical protein
METKLRETEKWRSGVSKRVSVKSDPIDVETFQERLNTERGICRISA